MFARTKSTVINGKRYEQVQIVENHRVDGRTRQRVLLSLGNRESLAPDAVDRLVLSLARYGSVIAVPRPNPDSISGSDASFADPGLGHRDARRFGDVFALDSVWRWLGLRDLLRRYARGREFQHDLERATFAMVANRLIEPASKLKTETWLDTEVYLPLDEALTADHFYRTVVWLHEVKDELEVATHRLLKRRGLTGATVYFYDTTLTYFEGAGPPGLAQVAGRRGRMPGKQHVLVGLVMTSDGWPVTYQLFPGASHDTTTFKHTLRDLYQRFGLREIVIICDRGMHSEEVIRLLEEKDGYDYRYIVATRLRKVEEVNENVLARAGRYHTVEDGLEVKEVWVENRRYVVCRSQESAERDANRRDAIVKQLEEKVGEGLDPNSQAAVELRASGNKRYLTVRSGRLVVNRKAIKRDARYDGRWVLRTNLRELDPGRVALRYKDESRIERTMLTIKDFVGLRPVFHHYENTVSGHVFVCMLALLLYRGVQDRLGIWPANKESVDAVLSQLGKIQACEYRVGRQDEEPRYFWGRSDLSRADEDLLLRLGIKRLPRVLQPPPSLTLEARGRTQARRERRRKTPRPGSSPDVEVLR